MGDGATLDRPRVSPPGPFFTWTCIVLRRGAFLRDGDFQLSYRQPFPFIRSGEISFQLTPSDQRRSFDIFPRFEPVVLPSQYTFVGSLSLFCSFLTVPPPCRLCRLTSMFPLRPPSLCHGFLTLAVIVVAPFPIFSPSLRLDSPARVPGRFSDYPSFIHQPRYHFCPFDQLAILESVIFVAPLFSFELDPLSPSRSFRPLDTPRFVELLLSLPMLSDLVLTLSAV